MTIIEIPTDSDLYMAEAAQRDAAHLHRLSRLAQPCDRRHYQEQSRLKSNEARFWLGLESLIFDPI